jgi:hypothetical protein
MPFGGLPRACRGLNANEVLQGATSPETGYAHLTMNSFFRIPTMSFLFGDGELTISARTGLARTVLEIEPKYVEPCKWISARQQVFKVGDLLAASPQLSLDDAREILTVLAVAEAVVALPQEVVNTFAGEPASGPDKEVMIEDPTALREVEVAAVTQITPRILRVTLFGEQLGFFTHNGVRYEPFSTGSPDDHVRLFWDDRSNPSAVSRDYTARHHD